MYSGAEFLRGFVEVGDDNRPAADPSQLHRRLGVVARLARLFADNRHCRVNLSAGIGTVIDAGLDRPAAVFGRLDQALDVLCRKEHVMAKVDRLWRRLGQFDAQVVAGLTRRRADDRRSFGSSLRVDPETHGLAVRVFERDRIHLSGQRLALAALHLRQLPEAGSVALAGRPAKFVGDQAAGRDRSSDGGWRWRGRIDEREVVGGAMRRERQNRRRAGVGDRLQEKKGGGAERESQDHDISTMDDI